jgi:hypothetical protein
MTHFSQSGNAIIYLSDGSDDNFEAKLITARCIRCSSAINKDFQKCDQTALPSTAIPAPKIWRRNSKKQPGDKMSSNALNPEIFKPMSGANQVDIHSFESAPAEMDEWAKVFSLLVGLNKA